MKKHMTIMFGVLVVAFFAAIGISYWWFVWEAEDCSPRDADARCMSNLRMIVHAKQESLLEVDGDSSKVVPHEWVAPYVKDVGKMFCPLAKGTNCTFENSYAINAITTAPTCKIEPKTHRPDYVSP